VALVAGFDAYVIWRTAVWPTFLAGAVVGGLAVIYLVVNHPLGLIWRSLPAKELAIGILFTAGTLVALMPALPSLNGPFVVSVSAFAALCALNCISIARWEMELDRLQRKVSIATRYPGLARHVGKICVTLGLASFGVAMAWRDAALIFGSISLSGLLLGWLNASRSFKATSDQRAALADLVLLTPVIAIILAAL
jgi:hypothetical protein